jgi:hypothetical protein
MLREEGGQVVVAADVVSQPRAAQPGASARSASFATTSSVVSDVGGVAGGAAVSRRCCISPHLQCPTWKAMGTPAEPNISGAASVC